MYREAIEATNRVLISPAQAVSDSALVSVWILMLHSVSVMSPDRAAYL